MDATQTEVLSMRTEMPGIGAVRWVRSGRLYWLPEIGKEPVPGDELARREARLVERIRWTLGSSPYQPVTREPAQAARLLTDISGAAVTREEGPLSPCQCVDRRELNGRAGEDYADYHLVYAGLAADEPHDSARFRCPSSGARWRLTYPGPTPHGGPRAVLTRVDEGHRSVRRPVRLDTRRVSPAPGMEDLLRELADLLRQHNELIWADLCERFATEAADAATATERSDLARSVLRMYQSGIGGFQDVVLMDHGNVAEDHGRLDSLRSELVQQAREQL